MAALGHDSVSGACGFGEYGTVGMARIFGSCGISKLRTGAALVGYFRARRPVHGGRDYVGARISGVFGAGVLDWHAGGLWGGPPGPRGAPWPRVLGLWSSPPTGPAPPGAP